MRTCSDRRNKEDKKRKSKQYKAPAPEVKAIHPRTLNQEILMESIGANPVTLVSGAAGVGKSLVTFYKAIQLLERGKIDQILYVKPVVEFRGEKGIGFLPGELDEKIAPLMASVNDALEVFVSKGKADYLMKKGAIKFELVEYIRGRSLRNKFVIFDEAQNATKHSILTVMSRLEESSKLVVLGDPDQQDVFHNCPDGLTDAMNRLVGLDEVGIVKFTTDDIQRAGFLKDVIRQYQN